ncbi:hypothetical protein ACLFMI_01360 [Pseudonocardia nantongensis]|uniref:hypothetical protein n=1 Tax=Pseudonocardia nantongensis TaxID=1181885 RepID=UPI00397A7F41
MGLHVLLAGLPLLSISAHVFGLLSMQTSAAVLVIPLATGLVVLTAFDPHPGDRVLAHGLAWGVVACLVYDVFRLDTVYLLDLWGDFIPTMGTWITGRPDDLVGGAVVGYLWRYLGDGGGIGMTFFVVASMCGLHQRSRAVVVLTAVGFAVAPVWSGLIGTVALAPDGEDLMFPLTPTTVTLSLIGHLIFGLILGLGFWQSKGVLVHWPWSPLLVAQPARTGASAGTTVGSPTRSRAVPPGASRDGPQAAGSAVPQVASAAGAPGASWAAPPTASPSVRSAPSPAAPSAPSSAPTPAGSPALPPARSPAAMSAATGPPDTDTSVPDSALIPRQRTSSTPPGAQTLDPDTWAQWQRRLESTEPGRRAHGGRRAVQPVQHGAE